MKPHGVWGIANETSGRINASFIGAKLRFSFETNKSFLKKVWKKLGGNLLLPSIPFAGISYLFTRDSNQKD